MPLEHLGHLMSETTSAGLMLACSLVALVACLVSLGRASEWARRAREAEEALAGAGTLREGGSVVVGVARTDGEPAITVTIREVGNEWSTKEGVRHAWRETERETTSRAFVVVTEKGERVRVEPPADVFLVDHLRETSRPSRHERVRKAELVDGERVSVTGRLHHVRPGSAPSAYRTAHAETDVTWALDPPTRGRMIVSTEPMAERATNWARFHRRLSLVPLAFLLIANAVAYPSFYDFVLHGRPVVGHVRERDSSSSFGQHGLVWHYRMYVDVEGGGAWVPLDGATYHAVEEGAAVPLVLTPSGRASLGAEPGLSIATGVILVLVLLLLLSIGRAVTERRKLWWERRRVVTGGRGPLERS